MPETKTSAPQADAAAAPTKIRTPSVDTIAKTFLHADLAVKGTRQNPEIQSALLSTYNYTSADVDALEALIASTKALFEETLQSRADRVGHTESVKTAFKTARTACADFALMCRTELKGNTAALTALGLTSGPAPLALASFLTYADTLFDNALRATGDVKATFDKRGYTAARLTTEKAKVEALRAANAAQESAKAKAQSLTPQQRAALDSLTREVNKLRKYARRALAETPQLLEALGISAP
jgi:predicted transglutaminase-like cysteine proteinase